MKVQIQSNSSPSKDDLKRQISSFESQIHQSEAQAQYFVSEAQSKMRSVEKDFQDCAQQYEFQAREVHNVELARAEAQRKSNFLQEISAQNQALQRAQSRLDSQSTKMSGLQQEAQAAFDSQRKRYGQEAQNAMDEYKSRLQGESQQEFSALQQHLALMESEQFQHFQQEVRHFQEEAILAKSNFVQEEQATYDLSSQLSEAATEKLNLEFELASASSDAMPALEQAQHQEGFQRALNQQHNHNAALLEVIQDFHSEFIADRGGAIDSGQTMFNYLAFANSEQRKHFLRQNQQSIIADVSKEKEELRIAAHKMEMMLEEVQQQQQWDDQDSDMESGEMQQDSKEAFSTNLAFWKSKDPNSGIAESQEAQPTSTSSRVGTGSSLPVATLSDKLDGGTINLPREAEATGANSTIPLKSVERSGPGAYGQARDVHGSFLGSQEQRMGSDTATNPPVEVIRETDTGPGVHTTSEDGPTTNPGGGGDLSAILETILRTLIKPPQEAQTIQLDPCPNGRTIRAWALSSKQNVASASGIPNEAYKWAAKADTAKSLEELEDDEGKQTLSIKFAVAQDKMVKSNPDLDRKIRFAQQEKAKKTPDTPLLNGRQIYWFIKKELRLSPEEDNLTDIITLSNICKTTIWVHIGRILNAA